MPLTLTRSSTFLFRSKTPFYNLLSHADMTSIARWVWEMTCLLAMISKTGILFLCQLDMRMHRLNAVGAITALHQPRFCLVNWEPFAKAVMDTQNCVIEAPIRMFSDSRRVVNVRFALIQCIYLSPQGQNDICVVRLQSLDQNCFLFDRHVTCVWYIPCWFKITIFSFYKPLVFITLRNCPVFPTQPYVCLFLICQAFLDSYVIALVSFHQSCVQRDSYAMKLLYMKLTRSVFQDISAQRVWSPSCQRPLLSSQT